MAFSPLGAELSDRAQRCQIQSYPFRIGGFRRGRSGVLERSGRNIAPILACRRIAVPYRGKAWALGGGDYDARGPAGPAAAIRARPQADGKTQLPASVAATAQTGIASPARRAERFRSRPVANHGRADLPDVHDQVSIPGRPQPDLRELQGLQRLSRRIATARSRFPHLVPSS